MHIIDFPLIFPINVYSMQMADTIVYTAGHVVGIVNPCNSSNALLAVISFVQSTAITTTIAWLVFSVISTHRIDSYDFGKRLAAKKLGVDIDTLRSMEDTVIRSDSSALLRWPWSKRLQGGLQQSSESSVRQLHASRTMMDRLRSEDLVGSSDGKGSALLDCMLVMNHGWKAQFRAAWHVVALWGISESIILSIAITQVSQ